MSHFLVMLLVGCESVESKDIGTGGISADFQVVSNDGAAVQATGVLRAGGLSSNTYLELTDGDTLTVDDGSGPKEMSALQVGDFWSYLASFDTAASSYTFALNRVTEESAPASTVDLPTAYDLTGPAADTVFSRATDPITLTWTPTADQTMEVHIQSDCISDDWTETDGDPGTYTWEVGSYTVVEGSETLSCEATLEVRRKTTGTLDPAYGEGGVVAGIQSRKVSVRSDP